MKRIQRKRTKGWRMPPGCVYVGRPTRWGNDFEVGVDGTQEECVQHYKQMLLQWQRNRPEEVALLLHPLRGKDLCCWCAEGEPCHADTLLELANP